MNQMNALAAIVAVSRATLGTPSMSGAQQAGSNEDEAAIRKIIVEMTDGFNNHDGNRLPSRVIRVGSCLRTWLGHLSWAVAHSSESKS
jgi:hypothetical protein